MPRGDRQAIAQYRVGLPDKKVISSVTEAIKPMLEQFSFYEWENQTLIKLHSLLLPRLLAGEIDLSNIQEVMDNG